MQVYASVNGFLNLAGNDLVAAIAQNLIVSSICVPIAVFVTGAVYRTKLTRKDRETQQARAALQGAERSGKALGEELEQLKKKFADLSAASLANAFTACEREEGAGNYEGAAGALHECFERKRLSLARLAGALGDWYAGFLNDERAARFIGRAKGFYSMARFTDPGNDRWRRAAEELELAAAIAGPEAGSAPDTPDDFSDGFAYAMGSSPKDPAVLIADLLKRAGIMRDKGNYYGASLLARRAHCVASSRCAEDHPELLSALHMQASCMYSLGSYDEALSKALAVLKVRDRARGKFHLETAESLSLAGAIYLAQSDYKKAEPLLQRALDIYQKTPGALHPSAATTLQYLASLYDAQERFAEAEPLYHQALAIVKDERGPEAATMLNGLAEHYRIKRRYEKAEPLYKRALAIRESALGAEHPSIAESLNNLASLYCCLGRKAEEAEPLLKRALTINEKALGASHPDTATSLNNLAGLYWSQGRYAQARPLFERALAIKEKTLGAQHPDAGLIRANLDRMRAEEAQAPAQQAGGQPGGGEPDLFDTLQRHAAAHAGP